MTMFAGSRSAAGVSRPMQNALPAFVLSALIGLTPALMAHRLVGATVDIRGLLDWTICAASTPASGRPAAVPTVTGSEPLAAEPHKRITWGFVDFPPNAYSTEQHHE